MLSGYPLFGLTVPSHAELLRWVEHLTKVNVEHSGLHQVHLGWAVTITCPDLIRIRLQTDEGPSGEEGVGAVTIDEVLLSVWPRMVTTPVVS